MSSRVDEIEAGQCNVSVTGKHRIDHPYCKDCGLVLDARSVTFATAPTESAATELAGQQCYWCKHPDHGDKVCPMPHLAIGNHGLSGSYPCGCTHSVVINAPAAPVAQPPHPPNKRMTEEEVAWAEENRITGTAAMNAAREIIDYIALPDEAEPADSDGSPTNYIAAIFSKHCSAEVSRLNSEVERLQEWKQSASALLSRYDSIAATFGGELGSSKIENLERGVRHLRSNARKEETKETRDSKATRPYIDT